MSVKRFRDYDEDADDRADERSRQKQQRNCIFDSATD